MRKINIVNMKISDISEVSALEKLYFSSPWSEKALTEIAKNNLYYFLCAKYNNKIVGYSGMYSANLEGYVCNILVDKDFRGRKVGTRLLNELLNYSKNIQLEFLSLEVRKSNEIAVSFYEKLGFKIQGIRKGFYDFPKEDAFIMTHFLK